MITNEPNESSRRDFMKTSGKIAAASALAGVNIPLVHGQESNTINVALVGCGGRGTGAADNAMNVNNGPVKLTAMADVFQHRLDNSYRGLKRKMGALVDVPEDRKFIGFDAYKNAIDCLRPGDVAIFTTPLAFRWVHFTYAIEKGVNVFMEKPLTADGPTSRRMIALADKAAEKNLKVGVGLMSRHTNHLQQLYERVSNGDIGDLVLMRGYRMHGPVGSMASLRMPADQKSELLWQISRFHSFLWASGGCYSDFYIHHIDHLCWMKGSWPVKVQALGGRHYKVSPGEGPFVDQNFDSYSAEYVFEDGARMIMDGRCITGAESIYSSYLHGTRGSAICAKHGDYGSPSSIYKGQNQDRDNMIWEANEPRELNNPYQNEWNVLVDAIRNDTPHNEVKRGVNASLVTSMGRMAAHTGVEITFEQMLNSDHEYAPGADKFTMDSPAPLVADGNGKYPVPMPGLITDREYPDFTANV